MANVLILEPDFKLATEQLQFLKELGGNVESYHLKSLKEFEETYFEIQEDNKPIDSIDIIIVKYELVSKQGAKNWLNETLNKCLQLGYIKDPLKLKFIFNKYEDDGVEKHNLIHPNVFDIFYIPFDRLMYLQKIELIRAIPEVANPTFLFTEKVDQNIEISKRVKVERLSGIGFSMKNPMPITKGTVSRLYIKTSENDTIGVHAKVIGSRPIESTNSFFVDFIFFGLHRLDYDQINRMIKAKGITTELIENEDNSFLRNENSKSIDLLDSRIKHILVIDEGSRAQSLCEDINSSISFVEAQTEESLSDFSLIYLTDHFKRNNTLSTLTDIPGESLSITISADTLQLKNFKSPLDDSIHFLKHSINDFLSEPQAWRNIFNTADAQKALEKTLLEVSVDKKIKHILSLENADYELRDVVVEFTKTENNNINIKFSPALKKVESRKKTKRKAPLKKIDLIIINSKFITENKDEWMDKISEALVKNQVNKKANDLKFVFISPDYPIKIKGHQRPPILNNTKLANYFTGIAPRTLLMTTVAQTLNRKFTKYNIDNINWLNEDITCFIARPAQLNSIAEFGASIEGVSPVAPGAQLYVHGYLFDHAPEKLLAVRFYGYKTVEPQPGDPSAKKTYISYFTYFGINDSFLKYARKWIKDNYASKKEQLEAG